MHLFRCRRELESVYPVVGLIVARLLDVSASNHTSSDALQGFRLKFALFLHSVCRASRRKTYPKVASPGKIMRSSSCLPAHGYGTGIRIEQRQRIRQEDQKAVNKRTLFAICPDKVHEVVLTPLHCYLALAWVSSDPRLAFLHNHFAALELHLVRALAGLLTLLALSKKLLQNSPRLHR